MAGPPMLALLLPPILFPKPDSQTARLALYMRQLPTICLTNRSVMTFFARRSPLDDGKGHTLMQSADYVSIGQPSE
jgi:hypothetical protein